MIRLPAGLLLFDTGIYIRFSRGEDYDWLGQDAHIFHRTVLSAVVAAELYAGTRGHREKRNLDDLCRAHASQGRFSAPTAGAWRESGVLLQRAKNTFGQVDFIRHFRDILIAQEAVRSGATLVTENVRDFARWKSLLGATRQTLRIFDPSQCA